MIREGIEQFEPLVRVLRAKHSPHEWQWVLGRALTQQGLLCFRKGWIDRAWRLMEESISVLRPLNRKELLIDPMIYLGIMKHLENNIAAAKSLFEEGLTCARSYGEEWFTAYAIYNPGYIDSLLGNYKNGYEQMGQALTMFRAVGDRYAISIALNHLVPTLIKLERYEEAKSYLWESVTSCEQTKDRWGTGTTYRFLGLTALAEGQYTDAQMHFRKSLEIFGEYIVGWDIARSMINLADALLLAGSVTKSRETYIKALHAAEESKSISLILDALAGLSELDLKAGQTERAYELSSLVLNHDSSTKDAKDRACRIRCEASKCLDHEQIRTLEEQPSQQSFEAIVNALS